MKQLRIAIAEDEWLLSEALRGQLQRLGHAVVGVARTGEELIATVAHERPDLALVDIGLARGSDGLAAAQRIQERFAVPAVALSGHMAADEARDAKLCGFIGKPVTEAKLRTILGRIEAAGPGGGGRRAAGVDPFLSC